MDNVSYVGLMFLLGLALGAACIAIAWHCTARHIDKTFE